LYRPVTSRAILTAFSLASAPPSVKNTLVNPGPASASSRSASSVLAGNTAWAVDRHSWSAWRLIASTIRRRPWPALTW
jgi:hypothetical protein